MGPLGRTAVGFAVGYLLVSALVDPPVEAALALWSFVAIAGFAAAVFSRASRAAVDPDLRRGFAGYSISFAATAAGTAITAWQRLVLDVDPTYSWANIPYLLSYPAAMVGVLSLRAGARGAVERWRLAIDTTIAVIAAAVISWLYVIVPLTGGTTTPLQMVLTYAYPVGDVVLFAALVPTLLDPWHWGRAPQLRLLAAGQLMYLVGDLSYQLPKIALPGYPFDLTDSLYLAGYIGLIWAAEAFARDPPRAGERRGAASSPTPIRNPLPIALGIIIYVLLVTTGPEPGALRHLVLGATAVAVTVLILIRERLTEQQNVELARALETQRSVARFRTTIQSLRVGMIVLDGSGRCQVANPAALEMLGLREDELIDRALAQVPLEMVQEDGSPLVPEAHAAAVALATKRPVSNVVVGIGGEPGERRWLLVDAHPTPGPDGQLHDVVLSLHDISERRALEHQLRQTQRLEAVGRLAGGVAHDFNNLLTAIIGQTSLLQAEVDPDDPRAESLADIRSAADRGATLTRQLLAFSRRQTLRFEIHDLNEIVRGVERLLRRLLGTDVEVRMDLTRDPLLVRVDRGQLEQVIVNLAVNARDAMPRGGSLAIATRRAEAGAEAIPGRFAARGAALLQVTDTGHGMDEATRARAFEPFFTTKEVGKGTGLGLSTVFGIVEQSEGEIVLESTPGEGTTVQVYFPMVISAPATAEVGAAVSGSLR
jgi:PAS domain S-box-containing protein